MPNQHTRKHDNAHHKIEVITEFPSSFKNVSPENGRKRAEIGAELAANLSADQQKKIADWVLSTDQRRNAPPLSLFVSTRSKPVEFCALVLSAVLAAYPNGKPVGMKELHTAYAVMHRTSLDSRCVRIAAWALGSKSLIRFADPTHAKGVRRGHKAPEPPVEVPSPVVEEPPVVEVPSPVVVEESPNEVALLREEVKSLAEIVDTLSKQLGELTRASVALAKRQDAKPSVIGLAVDEVTRVARDVARDVLNGHGVTLAQLAEVGMEIRLVPAGGAK